MTDKMATDKVKPSSPAVSQLAGEIAKQLDMEDCLIFGTRVRTVELISAALSEREEKVAKLIATAQELLDVMEICHVCKGALLLQEYPVHCEDCSADCENHEGEECTPIYKLHRATRTALSALGE